MRPSSTQRPLRPERRQSPTRGTRSATITVQGPVDRQRPHGR
jgi:hypothetical protein